MLDGHIKSHPAEDLDTPQRFSYLPKFLTEEEINRLLATPDISTAENTRSCGARNHVRNGAARFGAG